MKSNSKRLLSTLLALAMVFGLFAAMPMTASALGEPEAPSNLTATASTGGITLNWKDNSDDEYSFGIERREGSGSFGQIATVPENTTTYMDSTAEAGKTYIYRVGAIKLWYGQTFSNEVTITMPFETSTDGQFQVTEHPVGATYMLNEAAVPLRATFYFQVRTTGYLDEKTPIKVRWYWSYENSNTDRSNGFAESIVPYGQLINHTTTLTPATDTVGVRYYYAVLTYAGASAYGIPFQTGEAVTNTARVEVIAPAKPEPTEHDFRVRKVDEEGNLLSGAVIALVPNSDYEQDSSVKSYEETTAGGYASFFVTEGYYILGEKQAPSGYNATDEKYYIYVGADGVFIYTPGTNHFEPYGLVTFVNKPIPTLDKENHFAFIQGYPEGDVRPEKNMTRAEAVVMFSRLLTKKMNESADYKANYYPDVDLTQWYANQVCFMYDQGVLADFSRDGRFRPNDPVTRAEFATLAAHFDNLVLTDTNIFSDVPTGHWAVKYINSAAAKGWITGYHDGTFKPEANITRAEVATLVCRMLDRKADSAYLAANASSLPRNYWDITTAHWAYLAIMEASTGHDYIKDSAGENWTVVYP